MQTEYMIRVAIKIVHAIHDSRIIFIPALSVMVESNKKLWYYEKNIIFNQTDLLDIDSEGNANMIIDDYVSLTIGKQKSIALIAHDHKKEQLVSWCFENKEVLKNHKLCGTGTTARIITDKTGLTVKGYNSGPLGGDQQIGAKIVEGRIDLVIFFSDPLEAQPHDPDVKALLRIAQVYDIPMANNKATADFIITSIFMNKEYEHKVINYNQNIINRVENMINNP